MRVSSCLNKPISYPIRWLKYIFLYCNWLRKRKTRPLLYSTGFGENEMMAFPFWSQIFSVEIYKSVISLDKKLIRWTEKYLCISVKWLYIAKWMCYVFYQTTLFSMQCSTVKFTEEAQFLGGTGNEIRDFASAFVCIYNIFSSLHVINACYLGTQKLCSRAAQTGE